MRLCLIPLKFEVRNPQGSMRRLKERMGEAATFNSDLVCFPECCLTGYLWKYEDINKYAKPIPGPTTDEIAQLAQKYDTFICFGMLERVARPTGAAIYNSAVLLDRKGRLRLKHRKIQEPPPFERGKTVKWVDTELGRLAVIICGDMFNSKVTKQIKRIPDLDLLLFLTAGTYEGQFADFEKRLVEERQPYLDAVKTLGIITAMVSTLEPLSKSEEAYFCGANVIDGAGNLLAELHGAEDKFLILDM